MFQLAGFGNSKHDTGFYQYGTEGVILYEYWSPRIPCTGLICTGLVDGKRSLLATNHPGLVAQYVRFAEDRSEIPSLADSEAWKQRISSGPERADLWLWYAPSAKDSDQAAPATRILSWTQTPEGATLTVRAGD